MDVERKWREVVDSNGLDKFQWQVLVKMVNAPHVLRLL